MKHILRNKQHPRIQRQTKQNTNITWSIFHSNRVEIAVTLVACFETTSRRRGCCGDASSAEVRPLNHIILYCPQFYIVLQLL